MALAVGLTADLEADIACGVNAQVSTAPSAAI